MWDAEESRGPCLFLLAFQEHFWSIDQTEFRLPPRLIIQIWDNDKFSLDDYLGKAILFTNKLYLRLVQSVKI